MISRPKMRPARSLRLPPRAQVRVTSSGSRRMLTRLLDIVQQLYIKELKSYKPAPAVRI